MSADFSKIEVDAWAEPPSGLAAAKMEAAAWAEPPSGFAAAVIEVAAWIEAGSLTIDLSKLELVAWIDGSGRRRMSLM